VSPIWPGGAKTALDAAQARACSAHIGCAHTHPWVTASSSDVGSHRWLPEEAHEEHLCAGADHDHLGRHARHPLHTHLGVLLASTLAINRGLEDGEQRGLHVQPSPRGCSLANEWELYAAGRVRGETAQKKQWNKRWFTLAGNLLSYAASSKHKVPNGVFQLSDLKRISQLEGLEFEVGPRVGANPSLHHPLRDIPSHRTRH
jgi:hypothetical protein